MNAAFRRAGARPSTGLSPPGVEARPAAMQLHTDVPSSSRQPGTLIALIRDSLAGPARDTLVERTADGGWTHLTNVDVLQRADAIARALRERGIATGDRVALMSPNRVDWIVANLGILLGGAVTVPIYATQALDQVQYILDDAEARVLFVDTGATAARLREAGIMVPVIVFDDAGEGPETLAGTIARGLAPAANAPSAPADVSPDALAVLIYTSGTTGTPKGVMLSHGNLASNAFDAFSLCADTILPGDPVLSALPLAHIYEHLNILGYLIRGAVIYVNRRIDALLEDLRAVRPVAMFGVPRIFERVYAGILTRAREGGGVRAKLIPWAFETGRRYQRALAETGRTGALDRLQYALARALVLGKVRGILGCDRLRFFGSGSAALHTDIAYAFAAAGISIVEGYGLTECSPVVTANDVHGPRIGTVGRAIPNVEIRLAEDGELLVRGPNVMQGYYHRPEETSAILHDGWLATGDVATIDADGYVRIVDRKKEIFKTSGGKYVAPARVESAILRSPYVAQVVVLGNGQTHPAALISPNWPALRAALGLAADVPASELATRPDVRTFLRDEAARTTADLASFEQIRWIGVLPQDLSIDDGELTPTLKVKRRTVESRYLGLIPEFAQGRNA
jgi:long-chain acyl-CoA synthetase